MIDAQSRFKSRLPPQDQVESVHLAVQVTKGQRINTSELWLKSSSTNTIEAHYSDLSLDESLGPWWFKIQVDVVEGKCRDSPGYDIGTWSVFSGTRDLYSTVHV